MIRSPEANFRTFFPSTYSSRMGITQRLQETGYPSIAVLPVLQKHNETALMRSQAQLRDLAFLHIISTTLDRLESAGVYRDRNAKEVIAVNAFVANDVIDILAESDLSMHDAVMVLNRICTNGWSYPSWGWSKDLIRGPHEYRMADVSTIDTSTGYSIPYGPNHHDIPWLMRMYGNVLDKLIAQADKPTEIDAERIVTWAYLVYHSIQPSADGHTRTGEALGRLILKKLSFDQKIIPGFSAYRQGDSGDLARVLYEAKIHLGFSPYYYMNTTNGRALLHNFEKERVEQMTMNLQKFMKKTDDQVADDVFGEHVEMLRKKLFQAEATALDVADAPNDTVAAILADMRKAYAAVHSVAESRNL